LAIGTVLGRILGQFLIGLGVLFLAIDIVVGLQPEHDRIRNELIGRGFWYVVDQQLALALLGIGIVLVIVGYAVGRRGRKPRLISSLRELREAGIITEEEFKEKEKKVLEK